MQIIRELATNPVAALAVSVNKTKNLLNAQAKQEDDYVKEDDPYRNMYETIPWEFTPSRATLDKMDSIQAGTGPDARPSSDYSASCKPASPHGYVRLFDGGLIGFVCAVSAALMVGLEMIITESKVNKYLTKEIHLLTDGEREPDWDQLRDVATRLGNNRIYLTVV